MEVRGNKQLKVQRMLTYPQVCELMGFSRSTLLKLVNDGKIKSVKIGKSRRVWSEDFQAYIDWLRDDLFDQTMEEWRSLNWKSEYRTM